MTILLLIIINVVLVFMLLCLFEIMYVSKKSHECLNEISNDVHSIRNKTGVRHD